MTSKNIFNNKSCSLIFTRTYFVIFIQIWEISLGESFFFWENYFTILTNNDKNNDKKFQFVIKIHYKIKQNKQAMVHETMWNYKGQDIGD